MGFWPSTSALKGSESDSEGHGDNLDESPGDTG